MSVYIIKRTGDKKHEEKRDKHACMKMQKHACFRCKQEDIITYESDKLRAALVKRTILVNDVES